MKDSFWFKHDSTAGRDLKLRKIQYIYGHEGKGLFWDVIEVLREEETYSLPSDESSLQMLCDLIGYKDYGRFINWFKDCVRVELFFDENGSFFSKSLMVRMKVWESKKGNGKQPKRKKDKSEFEADLKRNESESEADEQDKKRREEIRKEYISFIDQFNSITNKNFKGTQKDKEHFSARVKEGYSVEDILRAVKNCKLDPYHIENPQYLTPEFITRPDKLQKYLNSVPINTQPVKHYVGFVENPDWKEE